MKINKPKETSIGSQKENPEIIDHFFLDDNIQNAVLKLSWEPRNDKEIFIKEGNVYLSEKKYYHLGHGMILLKNMRNTSPMIDVYYKAKPKASYSM